MQAASPPAFYFDYLVLLAVTLLAIILSLAIVFQAYRGYRRNQSQPMFYLAVGLVLLTVIPFVISLSVATLGPTLGFGPRIYTYYAPILSRLIEVAGLITILYSLYAVRDVRE
jgi:glycerol uptake facilitator-like aquaporin